MKHTVCDIQSTSDHFLQHKPYCYNHVGLPIIGGLFFFTYIQKLNEECMKGALFTSDFDSESLDQPFLPNLLHGTFVLILTMPTLLFLQSFSVNMEYGGQKCRNDEGLGMKICFCEWYFSGRTVSNKLVNFGLRSKSFVADVNCALILPLERI